MKLDIRIPLGLLFLVFGALLTVFGATSNQALYQRSLDINVNLWWGTVLVAFGLVMLLLGRRGHRRLTNVAAAAAEPAGKSASEQR